MKAVHIVLDCLQERLGYDYKETDRLVAGAKLYSQQMHMDSFVKTENDKARQATAKLVKVFMKPLLEMPSEDIIAFFENYEIIQAFELLSKSVLQTACKKYRGEKFVWADSTEDAIKAYANKILSDPVILKRYEGELSEVQLEIDYIKDRSDKLSLRMRDLVM